MTLSRTRLQVIRWTCAAISFAIFILVWSWNPRGGWAVLCLFGLIVTGAPAAIISLQLNGAKWFGLERKH